MSQQVHDMFAEIAGRYDRANTVLSLGVHHLWRQRTVRLSGLSKGNAVLDCATGTGDLAIAFKKRVGPKGRVVGSDFCAEMLEFAIEKSKRHRYNIEWDVQDAMQLTYAPRIFDVASIAFGIRNVDDPVQTLRSMARVVKPGGKVMVLEFGTPLWWMRPLFSVYSRMIIPMIGGLVSGNKNAYSYLTRTSAAFPTRERFIDLMELSDSFSSRTYIPLTGGIAYLYIGIVRQFVAEASLR
jgi:demethylmenaquinone methyltransferase / 2-methoxy-6-polyprenyl-1,4-benzoquinol methylase